jgi:hypothetical protein
MAALEISGLEDRKKYSMKRFPECRLQFDWLAG